jgi:TonB-dependent receptor
LKASHKSRLKRLPRTEVAVVIAGLLSAVTTDAMAAAPEADSADAGSLSEVTVSSTRDAQTESRAKQEAAPNIINTISEQEIRKLPDLNAGEAIARLPGAALSVDTGQGRWVNIRGLDADLNSTTYGGVHLPPTNPVTPQNGGRAFAFDTMPTGMIGALTITKTNRPDQDAEALGGTIDIAPKAIPADSDHFLETRMGTGRQYSRDTGVVDLSASGGLRIGLGGIGSGGRGQHPSSETRSGFDPDKPFSFIGSVSYYKDALGTDDRRASFVDKAPAPNLAWSNMTQAFYQFHRVTRGAGGEFAFQPNADSRWYARYLYSGYVEDVNRNRWDFRSAGTPTQNADGSITSGIKQFDKTLRDMKERVDLNVGEIGGENRIGTAKLNYDVAFAEGKDFRPYDVLSTFTSKPAGATITYNQGNWRDPTYAISGANQIDPNTYTLSSVTNNTQTYLTREWSAKTDLTLPTHLTSASEETLKVGLYGRLRTNTHHWMPYTSTAVPPVNMSLATTGSPVYYYDRLRYQNGYNISLDYMRNLFANGSGAGFTTSAAGNAFAAGAIQQDNKEDVYAAYAQEQLTFGRLELLAGLRFELTRATYTGNDSVPTSGGPTERGGQTLTFNGSTLVPVSSSNNYSNVFPTLQARYELRPDLIARATYSSAIGRPGFNQANPAATIDAANNIVTMGNAGLKPITSNNLDLSIERYFEQGGIASLGVFDKELSNYIFGRTQYGGITDPVILSGLGPQATLTQVVTYANIPKSRAWASRLTMVRSLRFCRGGGAVLEPTSTTPTCKRGATSGLGNPLSCRPRHRTTTTPSCIGSMAGSPCAARSPTWVAACCLSATPQRWISSRNRVWLQTRARATRSTNTSRYTSRDGIC